MSVRLTSAALAGLCLTLPACATARDEAPTACSHRNARAANPHGSVLVPVRDAPATSLLSDEILARAEEQRVTRRENQRQRRADRRRRQGEE